MAGVTYEVRIQEIEKRVNAAGVVTSYRVRWKVAGDLFKEPFKKRAQADSFRSDLMAAARKGESFDRKTGRPVSWTRSTTQMSWYDFACSYTDMKWKDASAKHRADIARVLMLATPVFFSTDRGRPPNELIRRALYRWGYNTKQRSTAPEDIAEALDWVAQNTMNVEEIADRAMLLETLDQITTKRDGKTRMAAVTTKKYRGILHNALEYAVVSKVLTANPLTGMKWIIVRTSTEVDRRSVVNPAQGRALLAAVEEQKPSGKRLVALFGAMLYCGLRPEEAVEISRHNLVLPERVWNAETGTFKDPPAEDDWGELYVGSVAPEVARDWTNDGGRRDRRSMPKHRAEGETRGPIPVPPAQVRLFRAHLDEFGTGKDGRLFRGVRSEVVPGETIRRLWRKARKCVLNESELASPLAKRPYDLRHTCLSTWLNAGIQPQQVAEWAGHSVEVLLRTYAKCLVGQEAIARRRIAQALRG